MNKLASWSIGGGLILILIFSAIIGAEYEKSEAEGRYYGTNEWMWPVPDCRDISSGYGKRNTPTAGASTDHKGIDIPCGENTNIVATRDGVVKIARKTATEGYWIAIEHRVCIAKYERIIQNLIKIKKECLIAPLFEVLSDFFLYRSAVIMKIRLD